MGYFDGLANASFKKDSQGRDLFFGGGIFGKGRILPDAETATALRSKVVVFYKLLMFCGIPLMIVVTNFPGGMIWLVPVGTIATIGSWLYFRHLGAPYPISDERLRYGEAQRNAARGHSYSVLILLLMSGLLFVLGGFIVLIVGKPEDRMVGVLGILFFGACSVVSLRLIVLKRRQSRR